MQHRLGLQWRLGWYSAETLAVDIELTSAEGSVEPQAVALLRQYVATLVVQGAY